MNNKSKVKVILDIEGRMSKEEHDGVVVVSLDKVEKGYRISTMANIPLEVGYKALAEAINQKGELKENS